MELMSGLRLEFNQCIRIVSGQINELQIQTCKKIPITTFNRGLIEEHAFVIDVGTTRYENLFLL
jgi:hypothetical protein